VSDVSFRAPLLDTFYRRCLADENSAQFTAEVSRHYTLGTLNRMVTDGSRSTRRAATLAIGFLGDFRQNGILGSALKDDDRIVRVLADNGIRELWCRDGSPAQQHALQRLIRLNQTGACHEAARDASKLLQEAPWFAEAWNQRAIAYFQLDRFSESIRDCRQVILRNRFHYAAAVGMGHCYLETYDGLEALECFRWALSVNPDMENVRAQVGYLQRSLEEK